MTSREGRVSQVWLPEAGVWAAAPSEPTGRRRQDSSSSEPTHREEHHGSGGGGSRSHKRQRRQKSPEEEEGAPEALLGKAYTGFQLLQSEGEDSEVEKAGAEPPPTCPICLTDILHLEEKAVVAHCMHVFCHDCITRWLARKHSCPMCKSRVHSVLYNITPGGDHKERMLPPSPPKMSASVAAALEQGGEGALALLRRLLDEQLVASLLGPQQRAGPLQPQPHRGEAALGASGGISSNAYPRLRQEGGSGDPRPWGAEAARRGAERAARRREEQQRRNQEQQQQRQGPRPYFWRLQQRLQAGAYRMGEGGVGGSGGAEGGPQQPAVSEEDFLLLWRRRVYDEDLWAEPLGQEPVRGLSLGSGSARERRLTEWVTRELRALLQTDDTTIVRGFCMGLISAHGLEAPSAPAGAAAAAALRPFLFEHAPHFWHELRCFATAPYSISTYDRTVRYRRRQQPQQEEEANGGGGGMGPSGSSVAPGVAPSAAGTRQRASRWDVRRPGAPHHPGLSQQQQQHHRPAGVLRQQQDTRRSEDDASQVQQQQQQQQQQRYACRNPSPPPLQHFNGLGGASAAPAAGSLPDQQCPQPSGDTGEQQPQRQHQWGRADRGRSRSRSGERLRWRRRSRSRRQGRNHSRSSRRRQRRRSSYEWHSRSRSSSPQQRQYAFTRRSISPGQGAHERYLVGAADQGDRWTME